MAMGGKGAETIAEDVEEALLTLAPTMGVVTDRRRGGQGDERNDTRVEGHPSLKPTLPAGRTVLGKRRSQQQSCHGNSGSIPPVLALLLVLVLIFVEDRTLVVEVSASSSSGLTKTYNLRGSSSLWPLLSRRQRKLQWEEDDDDDDEALSLILGEENVDDEDVNGVLPVSSLDEEDGDDKKNDKDSGNDVSSNNALLLSKKIDEGSINDEDNENASDDDDDHDESGNKENFNEDALSFGAEGDTAEVVPAKTAKAPPIISEEGQASSLATGPIVAAEDAAYEASLAGVLESQKEEVLAAEQAQQDQQDERGADYLKIDDEKNVHDAMDEILSNEAPDQSTEEKLSGPFPAPLSETTPSSKAVSTSHASALCQDSSAFLYKNKPNFTCAYIAAESAEKCHKMHGKVSVGVADCPVSCNMVEECIEWASTAEKTVVDGGDNTMKNIVANTSSEMRGGEDVPDTMVTKDARDSPVQEYKEDSSPQPSAVPATGKEEVIDTSKADMGDVVIDELKTKQVTTEIELDQLHDDTKALGDNYAAIDPEGLEEEMVELKEELEDEVISIEEEAKGLCVCRICVYAVFS